MNDKELLTNLSKLGLPMFEPSDEEPDVNETLAKVVKSHETRLWEGFPVLLANTAESYQFTPERVEQQLERKAHKKRFHCLMLLSGALFSLYHLSFPWWNKLKKGLLQEEKAMVKTWKKCLTNNQTLKFNDVELDPERLKGLFELYFEKKAEKDRRRKEKYEEFSIEYALSQVFPPKQKELFKKKLEGLPFTKTEQEYYSRTVKKKVVALANSELHSLSKKLLGL
jgi:hypothetical protein